MPLQKPLRRGLLLFMLAVWLSLAGAGQQRPDAGRVAAVAGDESAVGKLAAALVAAKTEEERAALLAASPELVDNHLQRVLARQGARLYQQGNFPEALNAFRASQNVAERLGDSTGVAAALNQIGELYTSQTSYDRALESYRKSLALSEASGESGGSSGGAEPHRQGVLLSGRLRPGNGVPPEKPGLV
ncbi:MAG: tetratricopeptide repeat protein [Terriglobales bacterium]